MTKTHAHAHTHMHAPCPRAYAHELMCVLAADFRLGRPEQYKYLAGSGCFTVDGVNDAHEFEATVVCMRLRACGFICLRVSARVRGAGGSSACACGHTRVVLQRSFDHLAPLYLCSLTYLLSFFLSLYRKQ